jgi:misacylated tRNA(Ala) deacylase
MAVYGYHEHPDVLEFDTEVIDRRPGAVVLARSLLHPGGGGQVSDRAILRFGSHAVGVVGVALEDGRYWHLLDSDAEVTGAVHVVIDAAHRLRVAQLHTDTHILNALVYRQFQGALVTGAQIAADGTARMDFDLPEVDNDALRKLEPELNALIRAALPVRASYVTAAEASSTPGLIRSAAVAPPPTDDGRIRIIDIESLDRQACGGTHLSNTAQSGPVRITKVENKGRHNRRIRLALVNPGFGNP